MHHVAYCLVVGLATNRTVILDAKYWQYVNSEEQHESNAAWNSIFQPLSATCTSDEAASHAAWRGGDEPEQLLDLPYIDFIEPKPAYMPLAIPAQIADKLKLVHGAPAAWFLGQITRYITRLSDTMEAFVSRAKNRLHFQRPIVGVHVRRTDKVGTEADYHSLAQYMEFVDDYYFGLNIHEQLTKKRDGMSSEKLVYLATDEEHVWIDEVPEFQQKGFKFLGDADIGKTESRDPDKLKLQQITTFSKVSGA